MKTRSRFAASAAAIIADARVEAEATRPPAHRVPLQAIRAFSGLNTAPAGGSGLSGLKPLLACTTGGLGNLAAPGAAPLPPPPASAAELALPEVCRAFDQLVAVLRGADVIGAEQATAVQGQQRTAGAGLLAAVKQLSRAVQSSGSAGATQKAMDLEHRLADSAAACAVRRCLCLAFPLPPRG